MFVCLLQVCADLDNDCAFLKYAALGQSAFLFVAMNGNVRKQNGNGHLAAPVNSSVFSSCFEPLLLSV
jgi:hypothetical protein